MRNAIGFRLGVLGFGVLAVIGLVRGAIQAQEQPSHRPSARVKTENFAPGFGGGLAVGVKSEREEPEPPVATVHLTPVLTPQSAATWLKLQEIVPMNFPNETPLEEVLRYVKEATKGKDTKGIPIYVDPAGLQEAEKTMSSPVTIDLDGITLASSLKLVLKQIGLAYYVQPDGLLVITSESDEEIPSEAQSKILDELSALRLEVAALRRELRASGRGR